MKCKICGGEVEIDFTKQLLSNPPKYEAKCKECGNVTYPLCSECHNTEGSCLQSIYGTGKIYQQGWECPKCGAVMSPFQNVCPFCSPAQNIKVTN